MCRLRRPHASGARKIAVIFEVECLLEAAGLLSLRALMRDLRISAYLGWARAFSIPFLCLR